MPCDSGAATVIHRLAADNQRAGRAAAQWQAMRQVRPDHCETPASPVMTPASSVSDTLRSALPPGPGAAGTPCNVSSDLPRATGEQGLNNLPPAHQRRQFLPVSATRSPDRRPARSKTRSLTAMTSPSLCEIKMTDSLGDQHFGVRNSASVSSGVSTAVGSSRINFASR